MILPVMYDNLSIHEKRLVREEYVKLQEGNCYYCGDTLSEKPSSKTTYKSGWSACWGGTTNELYTDMKLGEKQ